jgi:glycosyltransferase involved in cell wall biosynthesis
MEAWSCRKPVALIAGGEPAELVKEASGGVVVPAGDSERLAQTVTDLWHDGKVLEQYGDNGYSYVCKHFDRRNLAREMETVLLSVSGRQSR